VEFVEGYTTNVNQAGTAIGLELGPDEAGKGYNVAGAYWRQAGGSWHTSGPTCLDPGTSGQHIRMGVVEVEPTEEAPGREVVPKAISSCPTLRLHPHGGCAKEPSPQDTLEARVAADFERR
jgi:hypothetical protein